LSLEFQWLLKTPFGYKFDASIVKAAKIVTKYYSKFCPCCKTDQQNIEHWCVKCPTFLNVRLPVSDKLRLILRYFNENKFVDSNSNPSDNPGNNTHNNDIPSERETNLNINNSSEIDPVEVSNFNSNEDIIIEDASSNSSEHVNSPVDSYSSVNDNFSVSNNHVSNNNSSVLNEVFKLLLSGRCNNYNSREWKNLCKCQTKTGALSDTPFLTVTAALLNNIISIAIGLQRLLLSRFKSNKSKSVNAEITVRQASRASATNTDHNFVT